MKLIIYVVFIFLCQQVLSQNNELQVEYATKIFNNVKKIHDKDNGQLWGANLGVPALIINSESRFVVANKQDVEGNLKKENDVFVGYLPENLIISNSTISVFGMKWATVAYSNINNADSIEFTATLIHEMFHLFQDQLGIGLLHYSNNHIDTKDGRIYLKLECNALLKALLVTGEEKNKSIKDALLFRFYRRSLFSGSDTMENHFELQEGLAYYTELKFGENPKSKLSGKMTTFLNNKSFYRSFGYYTGACYAILNDDLIEDWRQAIKPNSDISKITQNVYQITLPLQLDSLINDRKLLYDFDEIITKENKIEQEKIIQYNTLREKFTNQPLLIIDLKNAKFGFNPNELFSLDSLGYYYPFIHITDDWGFLNVKRNGCLLSKNYSKGYVPITEIKYDGNDITTEYWILTLNKDWEIYKLGNNYFLKQKIIETHKYP